MNDAANLTKRYLQQVSTMQLATVAGDQPWVCTVRFLADDDNNIYWASLPTRRHSQEVLAHPKAACAIVVQDDLSKPIIGIQMEGSAEMLAPPLENREIVQRYADMFSRDAAWVEAFIQGKTGHRLFKFTPSSVYLIDEQNMPSGQRHKVL